MNKFIIERQLLSHNIETILKLAGKTPVIAVVKCNGYGLGLLEYARFLAANGIEIFGVSSLEEGIALRDAGFENEIILLTSVSVDEMAKSIVQNNLTATIGSTEAAFALARAGSDENVTPKAHIEIDTGMGRCGFAPDQVQDILALRDLPIQFTGTFTHFSFSFSKQKSDVDKPLSLFLDTVDKLRQGGFPTGILHAANSCAFLQYPNTHLDAVRIGSAFLGRIPIANRYDLKTVGYLESQIVEVNHLKKGANVGYGNTYRLKSDKKTAIVPVGYSDGFLVEKANDTFRLIDILRNLYHDLFPVRHYAEIGGKKAEIIGRTGMYNIICDITGLDAKPGDAVILKANPILLDHTVVREYV